MTRPRKKSAIGNRQSQFPPTSAAMSWWMVCLLLITLILVAVSGVGLWWCMEKRDPSKLSASLWELRWRQIHGWGLPGFLIVFGMVLRSHVFKGFQLGRNRFSGSLLLLCVVWLAVSGWGLYYSADDWWRHFHHQTHEWFGFGLIGLIFAHWIFGYRSRREVQDHRISGAIRQTGIHTLDPPS